MHHRNWSYSLELSTDVPRCVTALILILLSAWIMTKGRCWWSVIKNVIKSLFSANNHSQVLRCTLAASWMAWLGWRSVRVISSPLTRCVTLSPSSSPQTPSFTLTLLRSYSCTVQYIVSCIRPRESRLEVLSTNVRKFQDVSTNILCGYVHVSA